MEKTIRRNILDLPYCLHDTHINRIEIDEESIQLLFKEGYYRINNTLEKVHGYLLFEKVDFDFSSISIVCVDGNSGIINGTRYGLIDYAKKHEVMDLEIVDETYGYNNSRFTGFLFHEETIKEFIMEISHSGDMVYYTD